MVKDTRHYDTLGISPDADQSNVGKAYRKLAAKYHPDKCQDEEQKAKMTEKFQEIKKAYDVLSDEDRRRRYDLMGVDGDSDTDDGARNPFGQMFSTGGMFAHSRAARQVPPIRVPLTVTLEEVYLGGTSTVEFERQRWCQECEGSGGKDVRRCTKCGGGGVMVSMIQIAPGMVQQSQNPCFKCRGEGTKIGQPCKKCDGGKIVCEKMRESVPIEKGVGSGDYVKLENKGHWIGPKTEPGDVVVVLEVQPHDRFTRKGNHLIHRAGISLTEALCGGQLVIDHLDGHQIVVKLNMVIDPEGTYRINQEGMPIRNSVEKGDLFVKLSVKFPTNLDAKAKMQIARLLSQKGATHKIKENHYQTELQRYEGTLEPLEGPDERDEDQDPRKFKHGNVQCQHQ